MGAISDEPLDSLRRRRWGSAGWLRRRGATGLALLRLPARSLPCASDSAGNERWFAASSPGRSAGRHGRYQTGLVQARSATWVLSLPPAAQSVGWVVGERWQSETDQRLVGSWRTRA